MNKNKQKEKTFLNLLTPLGKKVKNLVLALVTVSGILIVIDFSVLRRNCDVNDNFTYCKVSTVVSNLYSSLITSAITIVGIELTLHDDMLKKIKAILKQSKVNSYLKSFYPDKKDYQNKILESFRQLEDHQTIKILCLAESLKYLDSDLGIEVLINKLSSNCKILIMVIHPESSLLSTINHPQTQIRADDLTRELEWFVERVKRNIPSKVNGKGRLIIQLHKSFSSIGYVSSKNFNLAWFYLLDEIDFKSPAFEIIEPSIISKFEKHWDSISSHAEAYYYYSEGEITGSYFEKSDNNSSDELN